MFSMYIFEQKVLFYVVPSIESIITYGFRGLYKLHFYVCIINETPSPLFICKVFFSLHVLLMKELKSLRFTKVTSPQI